jgi:hypothetical protein
LVNEAAVMVENNFIKKAYKYDYFIQIDLSAVNGLSLKSHLDGDQKITNLNRKKMPIANIFFRVK